jgi:hypothetical protein
MATKVYADVVVALPWTDGSGRKRFHKVGVVLVHDSNDPTKGPGLSIALDRHFNPAGVPGGEDSTTLHLSVYWPKDEQGNAVQSAPPVVGEISGRQRPPKSSRNLTPRAVQDQDFADDVPF